MGSSGGRQVEGEKGHRQDHKSLGIYGSITGGESTMEQKRERWSEGWMVELGLCSPMTRPRQGPSL